MDARTIENRMGDAELRVSSSVPNLPRISANGLDEPDPESALAGRTTIYTVALPCASQIHDSCNNSPTREYWTAYPYGCRVTQ